MINIREEIKKGTDMTKFNIINVTSHDVTIIDNNGNYCTYKQSGYIARALTNNSTTGILGDYQVVESSYTDIVGMPDPSIFGDNTIYLVSPILLEYNNRLHNPRTDFIAQNTSPFSVVRDESGQIVASRGFVIDIKMDPHNN